MGTSKSFSYYLSAQTLQWKYSMNQFHKCLNNWCIPRIFLQPSVFTIDVLQSNRVPGSEEQFNIFGVINLHTNPSKKSLKRTLWGLLGPQYLVKYSRSNTKTIRAISIAQINGSLIGNKMTVNHLPII